MNCKSLVILPEQFFFRVKKILFIFFCFTLMNCDKLNCDIKIVQSSAVHFSLYSVQHLSVYLPVFSVYCVMYIFRN